MGPEKYPHYDNDRKSMRWQLLCTSPVTCNYDLTSDEKTRFGRDPVNKAKISDPTLMKYLLYERGNARVLGFGTLQWKKVIALRISYSDTAM
jgi:hypothetical protein